MGGATKRRALALATVLALLTAPLPVSSGVGDATEDEPLDDVPLEEATIARDGFGVPHVYAEDERALWYANGYAQAEDRLWAMDLLRHISYGEAASVVGPGGGILDMDLENRNVLYNETNLEAQLEQADPAFREAVDAYAEGVNRAANEMRASGDMPAEFPGLQHAFEPWEPIDTVAVATFLLAFFGTGGGEEVGNAQLRAQLADTLPEAQVDAAFSDVVWAEHPDAYTTIQGSTYEADPLGETVPFDAMPEPQQVAARAAEDATGFGFDAEPVTPQPPTAGEETTTGFADVGLFADDPLPEDPFRLGSNALVVAPEASATGEAMVGGGPQMGYFNPEIPYELGLHLEGEDGFEAEGIGITGAPGVIIGANEDLAWTVTSGGSDQTDMVGLPAADEGDRSYEWTTADGGTEVRQLDCRTETHRVTAPPAIWGPSAAGDPAGAGLPVQVLEQEVCRADLSPSGEEPETLYPVTEITRDEDGEQAWFYAQKVSSRMEEVRSAIQWLDLARADDMEDLQERFETFSFTFNFNVAGLDEDGEQAACYFHVGAQPVRDDRLDPRLPTPAGDAWVWEDVWRGDELPRDCDPETGYYANWNNAPQAGWGSGDGSERWGPTHRVERLDQEVQETLEASDGDLTLDEVKGVLEDAATEDSLANQVAPLLLEEPYRGELPGSAVQALEDWRDAPAAEAGVDYPWRSAPEGAGVEAASTSNPDGEVYVDPGHTVWDRLMPALLEAVFEDELAGDAPSLTLDPQDSGDPHAGDHGPSNDEYDVLVDALRGTADHAWCDDVDTPERETCADAVREAAQAAGLDAHATTDAIPRTDQHESPFTSLGLGPSFDIPMTNRATYYHFHVGSDREQSFDLLPAGASGHLNAVDAARLLTTGETPEHMDDQLGPYVDFDLKQVPWTQAEAAEDESAQTLLVP
jgi:penicillin amidase